MGFSWLSPGPTASWRPPAGAGKGLTHPPAPPPVAGRVKNCNRIMPVSCGFCTWNFLLSTVKSTLKVRELDPAANPCRQIPPLPDPAVVIR